MYNSLILINGKKRSGKDYTAKLIQKELLEYGKSSEIISFADAVKDMLCITLDIGLDEFDSYKNNCDSIYLKNDSRYNELITFRKIIQNFGTEAMKKYFGESVWVRILLEKVYASKADIIIVPDFRFLCEHISDNTINIINDNTDKNDKHRSENELNDFEFKYTIDNTGYKDITDEVRLIVEDILS